MNSEIWQVVYKQFEFLEKDYGFYLEISDDKFHALGEIVNFIATFWKKQLNVIIEVVNQKEDYRIETNAIGLLNFDKCFNKQFRSPKKFVENSKDLVETCEYYVSIIENHCISIIYGDFSIWRKVENCLNQWEKETKNYSWD